MVDLDRTEAQMLAEIGIDARYEPGNGLAPVRVEVRRGQNDQTLQGRIEDIDDAAGTFRLPASASSRPTARRWGTAPDGPPGVQPTAAGRPCRCEMSAFHASSQAKTGYHSVSRPPRRFRITQ